MLDAFGPIGGYNFLWAWARGVRLAWPHLLQLRVWHDLIPRFCVRPYGEGLFDDFGQRRLDAVRFEDPLRGRHHDVLGRPALRPDGPERRRQVHVHEAADGRDRAAEGHGRPAAQARRPAPGPVRVRPVPRHRHRHHGQRAPVEGAAGTRRALRQAGHDGRRRHAPRRARGHRRRRGRLLGRERRRRFCSRASTSPTSCTSARWPSSRAARKCACCWRRRSSAAPKRCCSTSRPTTSTSTRSTGCRSSSSATTAR